MSVTRQNRTAGGNILAIYKRRNGQRTIHFYERLRLETAPALEFLSLRGGSVKLF